MNTLEYGVDLIDALTNNHINGDVPHIYRNGDSVFIMARGADLSVEIKHVNESFYISSNKEEYGTVSCLRWDLLDKLSKHLAVAVPMHTTYRRVLTNFCNERNLNITFKDDCIEIRDGGKYLVEVVLAGVHIDGSVSFVKPVSRKMYSVYGLESVLDVIKSEIVLEESKLTMRHFIHYLFDKDGLFLFDNEGGFITVKQIGDKHHWFSLNRVATVIPISPNEIIVRGEGIELRGLPEVVASVLNSSFHLGTKKGN